MNSEPPTSHHVEFMTSAPDSFEWHCLTCGAEFHSWSTLTALGWTPPDDAQPDTPPAPLTPRK